MVGHSFPLRNSASLYSVKGICLGLPSVFSTSNSFYQNSIEISHKWFISYSSFFPIFQHVPRCKSITCEKTSYNMSTWRYKQPGKKQQGWVIVITICFHEKSKSSFKNHGQKGIGHRSIGHITLCKIVEFESMRLKCRCRRTHVVVREGIDSTAKTLDCEFDGVAHTRPAGKTHQGTFF
jgi:hypothetical protein